MKFELTFFRGSVIATLCFISFTGGAQAMEGRARSLGIGIPRAYEQPISENFTCYQALTIAQGLYRCSRYCVQDFPLSDPQYVCVQEMDFEDCLTSPVGDPERTGSANCAQDMGIGKSCRTICTSAGVSSGNVLCDGACMAGQV